MKQKLGKWTLLLALFCLTGCGTAKQPSTTVNPQTTPAPAEPSPAVSTDPLLSPEIPEEADRTLVVYFSATGNTKPLAEAIAEILQADLFEIVPAEPYTTDDLNYNDDDSRSSQEMNDETSRPALAENVENFAEKYGPGLFVDTSGKRLGEHRGFPNYTIGQRKGLGIALGHPMFVVDIRPESNEVVLGTREELGKTFRAKDINLMKYASLPDGFEVNAKIRYRNRGAQASVYHENDLLRVEFHEGMDSITPGQSVVLYEGPDVVGGGIII